MSIKDMHAKTDVLILAGGQSRRMGRNKALLPWGKKGQQADTTLIEHLLLQLTALPLGQRMIAAPEPTGFPHMAGVRFMPDYLPHPFQGPLSGIAAALRCSRSEYLLVLSCDLVLFPHTVFTALHHSAQQQSASIVAAQDTAAQCYPLIALWHRSLAAPLADYLDRGERRVMAFVQQQPSVWVRCMELKPAYCNINTPQAYQVARRSANP